MSAATHGDPGTVSDKPWSAMTEDERTAHEAVRTTIRTHPTLSIPDKMHRLRWPYEEPTAEDYASLVDLYARIVEGYLTQAVGLWIDARRDTDPRLAHARGAEVVDFGEDNVEVRYYADRADAYEFVHSYLTIPAGDLLPDYGSRRSILRALEA